MGSGICFVRDSETTHGNCFANELESEGLRDRRDVEE